MSYLVSNIGITSLGTRDSLFQTSEYKNQFFSRPTYSSILKSQIHVVDHNSTDIILYIKLKQTVCVNNNDFEFKAKEEKLP